MFGYSREELIGQNLNFLHTNKLFWHKFQEKINPPTEKNGHLRKFKYEMSRKDGSQFLTELKVLPLLDQNSKKVGWISIIKDIKSQNISERKEAEQKLIESEKKYRLITENANDLVSIFNEDFRYEYINEATHMKVLGYRKEDLIGELSGKFTHPDDIKRIIKAIVDLHREGQAMFEERFRHKQGNWLWLDVKLTEYQEIKGKKKFLAISRDISDRKFSEFLLKKIIKLSSRKPIISHRT